jgi:hypothetical protein
MKNIINNLKSVAALCVVLVLVSFSKVPAGKLVTDEVPNASLQFVGKVDRLPVFKLVITNKMEASFVVTVKTGYGDVLFSEKLKGSSIARFYKLDTEFTELINTTTFEVTNVATNTITVYKLNNSSKTVEELSVVQL